MDPIEQLGQIVDRLDRANEMLSIIADAAAPPYYRPPAQSVLATAGGFATIAFQSFPGGVDKIWLVERTFLYVKTAQMAPVVGLFLMEGLPQGATQDNPNALNAAIDPINQIDYFAGTIQGGDKVNPILVKGGESLVAHWSGLAQNDRAIGRIMYRLAWQGQG